ncbi:MAG TPA: hypothetical protein VK277_07015 [Acidimicrobiales bacterium]|nr:hypothetical protein [Acidimicrobiales bacterium]
MPSGVLGLPAATSRPVSGGAALVLLVLVGFGYATIVWRRNRARKAEQAWDERDAMGPRPPGDPNRFEIRPTGPADDGERNDGEPGPDEGKEGAGPT